LKKGTPWREIKEHFFNTNMWERGAGEGGKKPGPGPSIPNSDTTKQTQPDEKSYTSSVKEKRKIGDAEEKGNSGQKGKGVEWTKPIHFSTTCASRLFVARQGGRQKKLPKKKPRRLQKRRRQQKRVKKLSQAW